ncbi:MULTISPECIES: hypothetical protein [unclassified Oleiphilus]|jgi:hypothetical protein|nr:MULTISPECIES: hypothetical protein [unclassified Oleiphilus]KZY50419.1 hypothetical protein A3732_04610 [Oleiphilus sp. HI0050]KZY38158.1 hypothetical protein A3729_03185 [Oleiphilus sp. HI0043]KZZ37013.1 hypothetical protein A3756_11540 [Oleiphilus sp. HI0086]KZZ37355.1 hypothetical protein A3757_11585 [Oleiphilus sp. HI0117]KZZ70169.1 hypothetical protein A3763_12420 [Oleiphilus sp. HI0128]
MNEQAPNDQEIEEQDKVKKSTLVIAIFITVFVTFFTLEQNGLIQHNKQKDDYPVAEYKAIFIEKLDQGEYRLSHKPSNQTAVCHQGYLFIQSDKNDGMQGLLVDYKNRGVRCGELVSK